MVITARSMKRALDLKLHKYNITSSQYTVLEVLGKYNGLSLTELGNLLHFDKPTITGIIDRMARAKLIRRRRNRNDRRVIQVYLTPKGCELQPELSKIANSVNEKAVDNFNLSDKKAILNLTKQIYKNSTNDNSNQEKKK